MSLNQKPISSSNFMSIYVKLLCAFRFRVLSAKVEMACKILRTTHILSVGISGGRVFVAFPVYGGLSTVSDSVHFSVSIIVINNFKESMSVSTLCKSKL